MDPQIANGIIAASGAVVGALLGAYKDELRGLFSGNSESGYLEGPWKCEWFIDEPAGHVPDNVTDMLNITKVRGSRIAGEGSNTIYGPYRIEGVVSNFAITLRYSGTTATEPMVGVVILMKAARKDRLEGMWWQYGEAHRFKGGRTVWQKTT